MVPTRKQQAAVLSDVGQRVCGSLPTAKSCNNNVHHLLANHLCMKQEDWQLGVPTTNAVERHTMCKCTDRLYISKTAAQSLGHVLSYG